MEMTETDDDCWDAHLARMEGLRDSVEIVRAGVGSLAELKVAVVALETRAPSEQATALLVDLHARGERPAHQIAWLLGAVGHPSGYATALAILRAGHSAGAEAMRAIAGASAQRYLIATINDIDSIGVRNAAAETLAKIATPSAIAFLVSATETGRLRAHVVAQALYTRPMDTTLMTDSLRSAVQETRRWPPIAIANGYRRAARASPLVSNALPSWSVPADGAFLAALDAVLAEGEPTVWSADAKAVRAWLAGRT